jgi:AcrR family transcriptional regulator
MKADGKRLKSDEKRRCIIERSAPVFALKGLDGARTREIAHACSVNESVIYRYFSTKDELFCETVAALCHESIDRLRDEASLEPTGLAALHRIVRNHLESTIAEPLHCAIMVHAVGACSRNPSLREQVRPLLRKYHELLVDCVERGKSDGSLAGNLDSHLAAMLIRSLVWGAVFLGVAGSGDFEAGMDLSSVITDTLGALSGDSRE